MQRVARSPLTLLAGLLVLYLALPLAAFSYRFLTNAQRGFGVPGLFPSLWVSLSCATMSLALITVFGVPLAYVLARSHSRTASVVAVIVQIPLALPPLMSGFVLIYLVGPYTFLGELFDRRLTNSKIGIVIAMSFVAAPFLIVTARAAFSAVDQGLLDVAATLGHRELSRFVRVAIPVAGGGIRAGMLLAWLRAFGEYGAVIVLAYNPTSLPIYAYNQFSGTGLSTTLAPTALAAATAVGAVLLSRIRWSRRGEIPVIPQPVAPEPTRTAPVHFAIDHRLGTFEVALHHESSSRHVAIVGASGSGKSALLRCLAGLYGAAPGDLWNGDTSLRTLAPETRGVGYVAQGFSLFPHLTVWQQLLFSPRATPGLASYWLRHLRLEELVRRYPSELSGGQRQRVALGQVLCSSPQILLLDEPFSAVDVPARQELRRELRRLQRENGVATILVTHDPEEAAFLSQELLIISDGRLLQSGSSREVFSHPASLEVAGLLGIANLLDATVIDARVIDSHGVRITSNGPDLTPGAVVAWSIRPERAVLLSTLDDADRRVANGETVVAGILVDVADVGIATDLLVALAPDVVLHVRCTDDREFELGDPCRVALPADAISVWATNPQVGGGDHLITRTLDETNRSAPLHRRFQARRR